MRKKSIVIIAIALALVVAAVGISLAAWRIDVANTQIDTDTGDWSSSPQYLDYEVIEDNQGKAVAYKVVGYHGKFPRVKVPAKWEYKASEETEAELLPVTVIGSSFSGKQLTNTVEIVLPNTLTTIEDGALMNLDLLQKITFAEGLVNIGSNVLVSCKNLDYIKLPSTIRSIGAASMSQCRKLAKIDIGAHENYVTVGEYTFAANNVLDSGCTVEFGVGV